MSELNDEDLVDYEEVKHRPKYPQRNLHLCLTACGIDPSARMRLLRRSRPTRPKSAPLLHSRHACVTSSMNAPGLLASWPPGLCCMAVVQLW